MKILGIDFELIKTPIEAISATVVFFSMTGLFVIGFFLNLYLLIFTNHWEVAVIYFFWIYMDSDTTCEGGRRSNWIRGWRIFKYAKDYYPIKLTIDPGLKLDPMRNYLFCGYPHAIFPNGLAISLLTKACGIDEVFPNHTVYTGTLDMNLKSPFYRDFLMSLGMCSVSASSLNYILEQPGGKIGVIIVGGAAEAFLSCPGDTKIILKNRKGFIKIAIKNGTPLVPIYSFGEVDVYNQYISSDNSLLKKLQIWIKDATSIALPLFYGRGILQKSFGIIPHRRPINVVVGKAISVEKKSNPTPEEVDRLHQKFMDEMTSLFEEYKYQFIDDPENKKLVIV